MRICVFCSSSTGLPNIYVSAAYNLGASIARRGHELIFGGFETGTMGDVARGCADAGGSVIGVLSQGLIDKGKPVFARMKSIVEPDLAFRKERMIVLADAFVVLPGGLGTFDEFFSVISAAKVGEVSAKTALINVAGYYDPLVEMLDRATETGLNFTDWHDYADVFTDIDGALDYLEASTTPKSEG